MKLNFWQWLGLVLLAVGIVLWYFQEKANPRGATTTNSPPATQPAPAAAPAATQAAP